MGGLLFKSHGRWGNYTIPTRYEAITISQISVIELHHTVVPYLVERLWENHLHEVEILVTHVGVALIVFPSVGAPFDFNDPPSGFVRRACHSP